MLGIRWNITKILNLSSSFFFAILPLVFLSLRHDLVIFYSDVNQRLVKNFKIIVLSLSLSLFTYHKLISVDWMVQSNNKYSVCLQFLFTKYILIFADGTLSERKWIIAAWLIEFLYSSRCWTIRYDAIRFVSIGHPDQLLGQILFCSWMHCMSRMSGLKYKGNKWHMKSVEIAYCSHSFLWCHSICCALTAARRGE